MLHITDSSKDYLIPEFRAAAIRNFFKIELLASVDKSDYKILIEEKESGRAIKD